MENVIYFSGKYLKHQDVACVLFYFKQQPQKLSLLITTTVLHAFLLSLPHRLVEGVNQRKANPVEGQKWQPVVQAR